MALNDDNQTDTQDNIVDPDRGDTGARHLSEVEQLAQEMGWDPDKKPGGGKPFRTAQDWIKSTGLNNRNMRAEIKEMRGTVERIASVADKQVKREVQARAAEIEERFAKAVADQDTEGAARAAKDMRALEVDAVPAPANNDDAVDRFKAENPWFGSDQEATDYAAAVSGRLATQGVTDPARQLSQVREAVKKRFPEHFGGEDKPKPKALDLGEPGDRRGGTTRTKTFADMPPDARNAADRMYDKMKQRQGDKAPDRKAYDTQYAKDYFGE